MSSNTKKYTQAYVWIWLPGVIKPVVAGKLSFSGQNLLFNYGKSYLEQAKAISIYDQELPLKSGRLPLRAGLYMPGCIRDASPDAWGRRVILNRKLGRQGLNVDTTQFSELTYLLESGSDRVGALDFQESPEVFEARYAKNVCLSELQESVQRVEKGRVLSKDLAEAIYHGTSIGGARPKALVESDHKKYVAKFSSSTDLYSIVKSEFVAMRLAHLVGLHVASVRLTRAAHKSVLLIERFDRVRAKGQWQRRSMLSALTLLGLDEMMARYASYENLAEIIRRAFTKPQDTLKELFGRLVFNILSGNTDDHARNHAAFWDGHVLRLTPAYDICPQMRTGNEASQAMLLSGYDRMSRLSSCLQAARHFLLKEKQAQEIMEQQMALIAKHWPSVCRAARLSKIDQKLLWGRQFFNPFAFEDLQGKQTILKKLRDKIFDKMNR